MSLARYRYRVYPTGTQSQALMRVFGCARVVYHDALRARQDAHAAGNKLSDADVQRRVVTDATCTEARAWLGEVASVSLVQACQDARRAFRNWFDSLAGKRKDRQVGAPRFRSRKTNRQSIRLTRNGFTLRPHGRLHVAKIGEMRITCSRDLPWTCPGCGTEHDRDLNAARTILTDGRRVAAGLAETGNACGGGVSRDTVPAVASEAGTHRSVV